MRQALAIFRKDARREWPLAAGAMTLTALLGVVDVPTAWAGLATSGLTILWIGCWLYVTASVIQQERLPGVRQYWLTRPYEWRGLLAAKALFGAIFAALPLVAVKMAVLLVQGVSPVRHAAAVVWSSLAICVVTGLLASALAAVTGSLAQYLWALLGLAGLELSAMALGLEHPDWGPVGWIRSAAVSALIAMAAVPVLVTQYRWRATEISRGLLAAGALAAACLSFAHGWHRAWDLASGFAGNAQAESRALRLAPDSTPRPRMGYADAPRFPAYGREALYLPVRVSGIPAGAAVVSQRIAATVEGAGGRSWSTDWTPSGAVLGVDPLADGQLVQRDGPAWQYLEIDRAFYQAVKDTPARIRVSVAMTLLNGLEIGSMQARGRTRGLPLDGICEARPVPIRSTARGVTDVRNLEVTCGWPRPGPDRAYVRVQAAGEDSRSLLTAAAGSFLAVDQSVWRRGIAGLSVRAADPTLTVESWRAAGYLEVSLDIPNLRLSDYVLPRVTDPE
jgi:hypothetical protein